MDQPTSFKASMSCDKYFLFIIKFLNSLDIVINLLNVVYAIKKKIKQLNTKYF